MILGAFFVGMMVSAWIFFRNCCIKCTPIKNKQNISLKKALKNRELMLYYQPQIDSITQKMIGVEALLRWQHPQYGFIPPSEFIPLAEQTGLIIEIGGWVLREACLQNKRWQDKGYGPYTVAVNITTLEFYQQDLIDRISNILKLSGLEAKYLELELTESMALIDEQKAILKMEQIRALGVKIAVDDFGTGYSSLSYLKFLPIDILKLDRSFVLEIENDEISRNIILTIIQLAQILNIQTVAEGVETKKQIEVLKEMGCDRIQGYYYSKALPAGEIEALYMK